MQREIEKGYRTCRIYLKGWLLSVGSLLSFNHFCGSGSVGIRINLAFLDPVIGIAGQGARKGPNITNKPEFQPFKKTLGPRVRVGMFYGH